MITILKFTNPIFSARKRSVVCLIFFISLFTFLYFRTLHVLHHERRELDQTKFLYHACNENFKRLKAKAAMLLEREKSNSPVSAWPWNYLKSSRLRSTLDALNGTKTITGLTNLTAIKSSHFILPNAKNSGYLPAFHVTSGRAMVDVVIGITSVRRFRADYLIMSLKELINGLSETEKNATLIIVMLGEISLQYVLETSHKIEKNFTEEVHSGLIEVISPLKSYYPSTGIPKTLGDSFKRTLWRAKHVLDCVYAMAYGHTKGSYYLIMEDDVLATKGYMAEMKRIIGFITRFKPQWLFIDFSKTNKAISSYGKVIRTADIDHFIKYLQLFYYDRPLDFLIESYIHEIACGIIKSENTCYDAKHQLRVKSPIALFRHVGLFSSLEGKIQEIEDNRYLSGPTFYPHSNPHIKYLHCDISSASDHTINMVYHGKSYFFGVNINNGSTIEFGFQQPIVLKSYKLQSGNYQHKDYIFYNTVVEVRSIAGNYTKVGVFDEFGVSEGKLARFGLITAIRLRVINMKRKYVILSEIELVPEDPPKPSD